MLIKMTDDDVDDDDDDDNDDDDDYHMMGKRDGIVKHMMQFPVHSNVIGNKMWLHCNNLLLSDCLFDYVQCTTGEYIMYTLLYSIQQIINTFLVM